MYDRLRRYTYIYVCINSGNDFSKIETAIDPYHIKCVIGGGGAGTKLIGGYDTAPCTAGSALCILLLSLYVRVAAFAVRKLTRIYA